MIRYAYIVRFNGEVQITPPVELKHLRKQALDLVREVVAGDVQAQLELEDNITFEIHQLKDTLLYRASVLKQQKKPELNKKKPLSCNWAYKKQWLANKKAKLANDS